MLKEKQFIQTLQNNSLVKQYKYLINTKYKNYSEFKEKQTNRFLDKCVLKNIKTDEIIKIQKDIIKEFNETKNLTYLKCKELNRMCENDELERVFITLTNPSKFHPFISKNDKFVSINKNFENENLEERINESYQNIKEIYREFYKNVKQKENKNCKFIKIIEPHTSLICHLHRIFYINKNTYLKVVKKFENLKNKHDLKECKIERLKDIKGSSYIIKYLLKNYKTDEIKNLDGYKKLHKIRLFTMSNLTLSTSIFKKLYFNNKELNQKILKNIKDKKSKYFNLYDFYTKNTSIKIYNEKYEIIKEDKKNKRFVVYKRIKNEEKEKTIFKNKIEKKEVLKEYLKKIDEEKKEKDNKIFYEIKEKYYNYLIKEDIYIIDFIYKETKKVLEKITKILDFKIYDTKLKKEIYNNKNFILIQMI